MLTVIVIMLLQLQRDHRRADQPPERKSAATFARHICLLACSVLFNESSVVGREPREPSERRTDSQRAGEGREVCGPAKAGKARIIKGRKYGRAPRGAPTAVLYPPGPWRTRSLGLRAPGDVRLGREPASVPRGRADRSSQARPRATTRIRIARAARAPGTRCRGHRATSGRRVRCFAANRCGTRCAPCLVRSAHGLRWVSEGRAPVVLRLDRRHRQGIAAHVKRHSR